MRRIRTAALATTALAVTLTACSPVGEDSPRSSTSSTEETAGQSLPEYCANTIDVSEVGATADGSGLVVTWSDDTEQTGTTTYWVAHRTSPDESWQVVADVTLEPGDERTVELPGRAAGEVVVDRHDACSPEPEDVCRTGPPCPVATPSHKP